MEDEKRNKQELFLETVKFGIENYNHNSTKSMEEIAKSFQVLNKEEPISDEETENFVQLYKELWCNPFVQNMGFHLILKEVQAIFHRYVLRAIGTLARDLAKLEKEYMTAKETHELENIPENERQYNFLIEKYIQCCYKYERSFSLEELGEFTKDLKGVLPNKKGWNKPRFLNKNNWNEIFNDFRFTENLYIRLMELKNKNAFKGKPYMDEIIRKAEKKYSKLNRSDDGYSPRPEEGISKKNEYSGNNTEKDNTIELDKYVHTDFDEYITIPKKDWENFKNMFKTFITYTNKSFFDKFSFE